MGEGLREIAELAAGGRVVLFGEQAEVVADREQALEDRARFIPAAGERVIIGQPKGAKQEGAFAARLDAGPEAQCIGPTTASSRPSTRRIHGTIEP